MESPILKDGTILAAGKDSRVEIGTDRVVLRVQTTTSAYMYYGVMTDYTDIGKLIKVVVPGQDDMISLRLFCHLSYPMAAGFSLF